MRQNEGRLHGAYAKPSDTGDGTDKMKWMRRMEGN